MATKTTEELLQELINLQKGSGSSAGSGGGGGGSFDDGGYQKSIDEANKSMTAFNRTTQAYTKTAQASNFVANLFNKSTEKAQKELASLSKAIADQEQALERMRQAGVQVTEAEYERLESDKKLLQSQERMYQSQAAGADIVKGVGSGMMSFAKQMLSIETNYTNTMANLLSQGASGFQMAGAAMEAGVDKMNAANQAYAQIAQQAGQSLSQLGGKFAPAAGLALSVLGSAAAAASDAAASMAKNGIRIMMQEGDKLIKTHQEMTGSGLIFSNGMKGMIDATHGTKLRLEEMSQVVKENKESFLNMGIGLAEATKRVGNVSRIFASTTGSMAKMDKQLLALGFSYQEQAAMAAETMAEMKKNGADPTDKQVAASTASLAQNMALLASLSGEDAKRQKDKVKAENATLAFEIEKSKMSADQRAQLDAAMAQMTEQERQNLRERMVYGSVINKQGAIMEATVPQMKKNGEEFYNQLKNNALTTKSVADVQAAGAEQMKKQVLGNKAMAMADMAGKGDINKAVSGQVDLLNKSNQVTAKAVKDAKQGQKDQMEAAKGPTKKGDPTAALLDAIEVGAEGAKRMQEGVVKRIGDIAVELKKHYDSILKDLETKMPGSNGLMEAINKWFPIVAGALSLAPLLNSLGVFKGLKDALNRISGKKGEPGTGGGFDSIFEDGPDKDGKKPGAKGKTGKLAKVGEFFKKIPKPGMGTMAKVAKGVAGGGLLSLASVPLEMLSEKLKEGGNESAGKGVAVAAKAAEYAGMGAMIGTIIPGLGTAAGAVVGGVVGGAVGAYEQFGDEISAFGNSAMKSAKEGWSSFSSAASDWASKGATMLTDGIGYVKAGLGKFIENIKGILGFVADKVKMLFTSPMKLFELVSDTFVKVKDSVFGVFTGIWDKITSFKMPWSSDKPAATTAPSAAPAASSPAASAPSAPSAPAASKPTAATVKLTPGGVPNKQQLTADEKKAAMETVALNTKYTNDLLVNQYKNMEKLQMQMVQQLAAIASHTGDGAAASKKTAKNTT